MPHGGDDLSCPLVDIVVTGVWVVFVVVVSCILVSLLEILPRKKLIHPIFSCSAMASVMSGFPVNDSS